MIGNEFDGDNTTTARLHRDWLRRLPEWTGKSRTRIADETGIARTTLTNPLKPNDPGTSTLNATTIDKIVRKYSVPPPGSEATVLAAKSPRAFQEDAVPYRPGQDGLSGALEMLREGRFGVDPWTLKSRSLELEGYLPGDIVLVDLNATPRHGDAVCAQVYDFQSMRAETVMRIFENAGPIRLLVAKTMDPDLQRPLVIDDDRVAVKGVILPHRLRAPKAVA